MQITYHHRPQPQRGCVFVGIFNTPLQYAQVGDAHPASGDINRGAVTTSITPYWRRRRLCGDTRTSPHRYNRGAVADPAAQLTIYMADDMPSRWQTMLNRGWSVSVTCGSQMHHICSASKMSNIIVPLRGTYYGVHFPQAAPQRGLPAVKHGSAPSALLSHLTHHTPVGAHRMQII